MAESTSQSNKVSKKQKPQKSQNPADIDVNSRRNIMLLIPLLIAIIAFGLSFVVNKKYIFLSPNEKETALSQQQQPKQMEEAILSQEQPKQTEEINNSGNPLAVDTRHMKTPKEIEEYEIKFAELNTTVEKCYTKMMDRTQDDELRDELDRKWKDAWVDLARFRAEYKYGKPPKGKHRLFTEEEVRKYDGTNLSVTIYLIILGEVFDVTRGRMYYAPEMGYAHFSGRDGSRAFITGDSFEGSIPDILNMTRLEQLGVEGWRTFYHKEYTYLGRYIGWYWDSSGKPTKNTILLHKNLREAKEEDKRKKEWEKMFPFCKHEWTNNVLFVNCYPGEGESVSDFQGVPRKYTQKRKDGTILDTTCRCVDYTKLPPPTKNEKGERVYDLKIGRPVHLEIYGKCNPSSSSCKRN